MVAISLDPRRTLSPYYDELPTSPTSSSSSISGSSNGGDLVQRALRRAGLPQNSNTSTPSLLLFGASLILFLSSFSSYSSSSPPPVLGDLSLAGGSPPSLLPSKHYNSITSGRWIPPTFPRTKQDVIKIWGRPPGGSPGKGGAQRTLTVASWDWEPLEQIREWDSFEFVKRCFNSENGLLLVGDSVQLQAAESLNGLLRVSSSTKYNMTKMDSWFHWAELGPAGGGKHGQMLLRKNSTLRSVLAQELPHVPAERFERAFVHTIRHDTLLGMDELTPLAKSVGIDTGMKEYLRNDTWESSLLPTGKETSWEGKQNTILWLNTGAHWNSICFESDREGLLDLSRAMAKTLLTRLIAHPSLDIIYRSTATAHPGCENAATPIFPAVGTVDHPVNTRWDWGIFDPINQIWADELDRVAPKGVSKTGGKVAFLNVTEMAGQRPEAHNVGNIPKQEADCLHWALPTVPGTWLKMLWHIITDEQ